MEKVNKTYDVNYQPVLYEPSSKSNEDLLKSALDKFTLNKSFLFINIPQVPLDDFEFAVAKNKGYFAYPPQGLLYLAGQLESNKSLPKKILDLNYTVLRHAQSHDKLTEQDWQRHIDEALQGMETPVIGISFMFHATNSWFEAISQYIRKKYPSLCLITGGVNATADRERLLKSGLADIVVSNEGEVALKNIYLYGNGDKNIELVNTSALGPNDEIVSSKMYNGGEVEYDIVSQYHLIPIEDYHNVGSLSVYSRMMGSEVPFATVIAKRGCRAHCTFCGVRNFNGRGVRPRDAETIVDEMQYLRLNHGIRHFDWLDDDLLFDRDRTLKLFHRMAKELPDITWAANNGLIPAALNAELLEAMEKSHCMGFKIGLESGNPEMLKKVNKPIVLRKLVDFSALMQKYPSMFVSTNIILGLPEETFGQMLDSFLVSITIKLDWTNYYIYQPLRNTEAFQTFGGLTDQAIKLSHGKDNIGPLAEKQLLNLNPVRGKAFLDPANAELKTAYEIFDYDPGYTPNRRELAEIWFTFNTITNFFLMPAHYTGQVIRQNNGILFLRSLIAGYPSDPLMKLSLANLLSATGEGEKSEIASLRAEAVTMLKSSPYWEKRNEQFKFEQLLTNVAPEMPQFLRTMIASYQVKS